jgi:hypothetical protein
VLPLIYGRIGVTHGKVAAGTPRRNGQTPVTGKRGKLLRAR